MTWYIDGVRIFPQESVKKHEQIIAELNPLAGGSTYHNFGWSEEKRNVNVYIVGTIDDDAIAALTTTATAVTLSGPYGAKDYLVKSAASSQIPFIICQSIRPDLAEDDPVFIVDLELWLDE